MRSAPLPEILSIIAVPIGNPLDLSLRAVKMLEIADLVFCEDTRKTYDLFKRAGITVTAKLVAIPGDSEHDVDWQRYRANEHRRWAVVSDAGTPIVNDPGVSLLAFCRKHAVVVEALPGPSAPIAAWQWSGGFGLPFVFAGFAPKVSQTATAKWERFLPLSATHGTFCFFDTRHQIVETLGYLAKTFPAADLFIAREMTKPHEELLRGGAEYLLKQIQKLIEIDKVGELCLLLDVASLHAEQGEGLASSTLGAGPTIEELIKFRAGSTKDAAKMIAKWFSVPTRDAYKRLHDET